MNKAKEHIENSVNYDFDEFVSTLCEQAIDSIYQLDNSNGLGAMPDELQTHVIKCKNRFIRLQFINNQLFKDSICFVEEKEKVVKYYEPIKD